VHVEGIAEFKGRQQCLGQSGGVHREPVASGLAALDEALVGCGLPEQMDV